MVWFTLALFVVSFFLNAVLAPKPDIENARSGRLGDIRFPRASEGSPIPLIFGKRRLRSPNVLWYGGFKAVAKKKKIKTGLFTSKKQITGYRYFVGFDLGLCLGPNVVLHKIWVEKRELSSSTASGDGIAVNINQENIFGGDDKGGGFEGTARFYSGGFTQTPNPYLEGKLGAGEVPGYNGLSHIVFEGPYIGTSAQLRPLSFELSRMPNNLGLAVGVIDIGEDINPAEVIYDALTEEWGGLDVKTSDIDTASFIAVASVLATELNGISMSIESSNAGKVVITEVLRQIDGIMYQDPETGRIILDLIRNDYTIGNLPVLDPSNIENVSNFSRTAWADTTNQVRVVYTSRSRDYEDGGAIAQDMANINLQEKINSKTLSFPGCTENGLANVLAWREISVLGIPLYRATIRTNRTSINLRPGSPFVWTWPEYNILGVVMRAQDFKLGDLLDGRITMDVLQDKFAISTALYADPSDTLWQTEDRNAIDITDFIVIGAPRYFVDKLEAVIGDDGFDLHLALARDPGDMAGYDFLMSGDSFVNEITTELDQASFPGSATMAEALYKNMAQEDGLISKIVIENMFPFDVESFPSVSSADIKADGANLIIIGGEILAFQSATDNMDGSWDLNQVYRALLDTTFEDHPIGQAVYFLDSADWITENLRQVGLATAYKFLSFSDRDSQNEGEVSSTNFTVERRYQRAVSPDRILIDAVRTPLEIIGVDNVNVSDWRDRDGTTDTIVFIDDADGTPEASTFFTLIFLLDGVNLDSLPGVGAPPHNLNNLDGKGQGKITVAGFKVGLTSVHEDFIEFFYANYQNLGSELIANNQFTDLTNWTTASGSWSTPSTDDYPLQVRTGTKFLLSTGTTNELFQDVDVVAESGTQGFFRAYRGSKTIGAQSQIILEQRTAAEAILDTITIPAASVDPGKWETLDIPFAILSTCDHVRVRILAASGDAAFENVTLKANSASLTSGVQYDTITGVTETGAWGLRKMISTYAGSLVRIRDTFDDSEQDVGFDVDGNLASFSVVEEARVVRLYDQSGNAANLEPDAVADQPLLVTGLSETGRAQIVFEKDGSQNLKDQTQSTSRPYMTARPNMIAAIGPRTEVNQGGHIVIIPHDGTTNASPFYRWGLSSAVSAWEIRVDGVQRFISSGSVSSGKHIWCLDHQNGNAYRNDDAVAVDTWTAIDTTYPNNTALFIPEGAIGTSPWEGPFFELCIYSGNVLAADRKTLMESVADYWFNLSI